MKKSFIIITIFLFLGIVSAGFSKDGDSDATGMITSVGNEFSLIRVKGYTQKGPLWLGCTFFPDTENERDLKAVHKNARGKECLFFCNGNFEETFYVPDINWLNLVGDAEKESDYVAALWRYYIPQSECRKGDDGGPCNYCKKNGYHLEERVDVFPGYWSRTKRVTTREDSEKIQKEREEAEKKKFVSEQQQKKREENERPKRLEEQRHKEREEAQLQARLDEQRRLEREKTQRRQQEQDEAEEKARIAEEQRKEREANERKAALENQRKMEAEQKAKLEEQRNKAERQAQLEEQKRKEREVIEKRKKQIEERENTRRQSDAQKNQTTSLGIDVRTITPKEMKEKGFNEVFDRAVVEKVDVGSPASRAGLKPGMVITNVNGKMIKSASDFPTSGKRGDRFKISIIGQTDKIIDITDKDFKQP